MVIIDGPVEVVMEAINWTRVCFIYCVKRAKLCYFRECQCQNSFKKIRKLKMEDEEFYDSLDEGDCITTLRSEECNGMKENNTDGLQESNDVIPFYDGDIHKNEVILSEEQPKTDKCTRKHKNFISCNRNIKKNTYLNLFYVKNRKNQYCSNNCTSTSELNSNKAICQDLSPKSSIACDECDHPNVEDEQTSEFDTFYEYITNVKTIFEKSCPCNCNCSHTSSGETKLCSISEMLVNSKKNSKKCSIYKNVPVLGGLGPDIKMDKLELFRRRQIYGKKVSDKNRIRIAEHKVLKNLEKEIQISRINLNQQCEVDLKK